MINSLHIIYTTYNYIILLLHHEDKPGVCMYMYIPCFL